MSSVMLLLSLSKLINLMEGLKKKKTTSYWFGTYCSFPKKESVQSPFSEIFYPLS